MARFVLSHCAKVVLAIMLLAGCSLDVDQPQQMLWEASLSGSPAYPAVAGSAAAVANDLRTAAGVTVTGLAEGMYAWHIREGHCDAPGATLGAEGAYPDLVVAPQQPDPENPDVTEGVTAETLIEAPMLQGRRYHAAVQVPETSEVVACGDFVQR